MPLIINDVSPSTWHKTEMSSPWEGLYPLTWLRIISGRTMSCVDHRDVYLDWVSCLPGSQSTPNIPLSGAPHNKHKTAAHWGLFSIITWKLISNQMSFLVQVFIVRKLRLCKYIFQITCIGCLSTCQRQDIRLKSFRTICNSFKLLWLKIITECKSDEFKIEEFKVNVF